MPRALTSRLWLLAAGLFVISAASAETRVVVLGTGTPVPDAARAGSSIAVVVDGAAYVFDAGDGMVQRAFEASEKHAIPALVPQSIRYLFLTHLHSDHIHDVHALATSRWWSRESQLQVYGPEGLAQYVGHMNAMSAVEADIRARGTPPELITDRHGYRAVPTEIEDGVVFENESISIEAFTVNHGDIKPAFGYRIVTADASIVISGDTAYSETLVEKASGADLLFHEVISADRLAELSEFWQQYHGSSHTTTTELARVASLAKPKTLVLYHVLFAGASAGELLDEVRRGYDGSVVIADDLDIF